MVATESAKGPARVADWWIVRVQGGQLAAYQSPIGDRAVVATRQPPVPERGEAHAAVEISDGAKALSEHLEQAGEAHVADGCESCAAMASASGSTGAAYQATGMAKSPPSNSSSPPPEDAEAEAVAEAERVELAELKARDAEVRRHEQAHLAAAGGLAKGGAHYEFERGPDGAQYAVAGHVNIDTSPVKDDPEATIQKAETIRRAALAPAEPSAQDQKVAAEAAAMAAEARRELAAANGPNGEAETDAARQDNPIRVRDAIASYEAMQA